MRLRTLLAAAGGVLVLATPAFAVTPTPDCHGLAVTDAAGDQYIGVSTTNAVAKPTTAIDITGVFLTGSSGSEVLNLRVSNLIDSPNVSYYVRFDDPANFGAYYEFSAGFLGVGPVTGTGGYSLEHGNSAGFSIVGTTGRAFGGTNGVIQWDAPSGFTWATSLSNFSIRAEQQEGNGPVAIVPAVRVDTAASTSWTSGC
jgi:hypothetical protein